MGEIIRTGDFIDRLRRQNRTVSLVENDPGTDSSLMRGRFCDIELRQGLSVHVSDVVSLCDLTAETEIGPHMSIKFFFEGKVDAEIGNRRLPSPQQVSPSSRWIPAACMLANRREERFRNHTSAGNHIRKLKIRIEPNGWRPATCLRTVPPARSSALPSPSSSCCHGNRRPPS